MKKKPKISRAALEKELKGMLANVEPIFFCSMPEFVFLSNYHYSEFKADDGKRYRTIEHWYQSHKATEDWECDRIRRQITPADAKLMGRRADLREDWEEVKYEIMLEGLRYKFNLPAYKKLLLETGVRPIYEDRKDWTWGTGVRGRIGNGENLLGKALMQVREELRGTK